MPATTALLSEYVPERSCSTLLYVMSTGFSLGSALVGFGAAVAILAIPAALAALSVIFARTGQRPVTA